MANTGLPYSDFSQVAISADEYISDVTLNAIFGKLIKNDLALNPHSSGVPSIWECKWYNNSAVQGYSKGSAVWLNTEDLEEFINQKHEVIYNYAKQNIYLSPVVSAYDKTSKASFDLYASILSGYQGPGMLSSLPPLFDLGQLSANTQIYISLVDNNKRPPSQDILLPADQQKWMPFIKDELQADEIIEEFKSSLYDDHVKNYHLGTYSHSIESDLVKSWLKTDFSNIDSSAKQTYQAHINPSSAYGLDTVKYYVADRNTTTKAVADGSIQTYDVPTHWFRLWHSGLLEHGGYVRVDSATDYLMKIPFDWTFMKKKTVDGKEQLVSINAPTYNYPTTSFSFYQNYAQIENSVATYDSAKNFMHKYRYVVDVTPMSNAIPVMDASGKYDIATGNASVTKDIVEMKNDYIVLKLGIRSPGFYSYYVRGFKTNDYTI